MSLGYFDRAVEKKTKRCDVCQKDTEHTKEKGSTALWTCREPSHPHPTREEQWNGTGRCAPKEE